MAVLRTAYLRQRPDYIFFNEQFQMDASKSGAVQCGAATNQWNTVDISNTVDIAEPGYVLVFVGSKANSPVYWDQVDVTFYKGTVLEENHYYPFGLTLSTATTNPAEENSYKLTTKELEDKHGLNWYNFGARMQDMQIGRWNGIDNLAEKYYPVSPFAYVGNMPTKAIDLDGRKIIFVNGYYTDNWVGRHVVFADKPGEQYWSPGFVEAAQRFFNDHSVITSANYVSGSSSFGGDMNGQDRYDAGMEYAKNNLAALTGDLKKGEAIRMVTHSEGGAFGAGMARYLIDKGFNVDQIVHLSTDEGDEFTTPSEPATIQMGYAGDWVTGNYRIRGTDRFGIAINPSQDGSNHGNTKGARAFNGLTDLINAQWKLVPSIKSNPTSIGIPVLDKTNSVYGTDFIELDDVELKKQDK